MKNNRTEEQQKAYNKRCLQIGMTKDLMNKGLSTTEIAAKLNISESAVRSCQDVIKQADANINKQ